MASFTYVCDKERSVGLKKRGRSAVAPERGDEDASYVKEARPSSEDGTAKKVYPIDDGPEKAGGWLNQHVWATGSRGEF